MEELTKREEEVIRLVSEGYTSKEIATRFHIHEQTVKNYVFSTCRKLGASTRSHAVAIYIRESTKQSTLQLLSRL